MKKENLISVILPTCNRQEWILGALHSVLNQSIKNFDVWLIDDGSEDETKEKVNQFLDSHPLKSQVHGLFNLENKGVSFARNQGILASSGEWLAFLDSDDEWLPDKLSLQWEFLEKNPEFKWVHGEEIWWRNGIRVNSHKKHQKGGGNQFLPSLKLCLISPSCVVIHRSLFEKHGLFNEAYPVCEDYDLWLRFLIQEQIGFIDQPLIHKRGGHPDQLSHRYFAMDYWRIKTLSQLLDQESNYRLEIAKEIVNKSQILLKGYEKHQNWSQYSEVKIYSQKALLFLASPTF